MILTGKEVKMKQATQFWRKSICSILLPCALVFSLFGCVRLAPPETEPSASVLEPGSAAESSGATEPVQETTPTVKKRLAGYMEYGTDGTLLSEVSIIEYIDSLPGKTTIRSYLKTGIITETDTYTRDSEGRIISRDVNRYQPDQEPIVGTERYKFDEQGHMLQHTLQANGKETYREENTYDENGNLLSYKITDLGVSNREGHYEYNTLGHLIRETEIDGSETHVTEYEYNLDGTVACTSTTITNSVEFVGVEKAVYHYEYDKNGDLLSTVIDHIAEGMRGSSHLVMKGQTVIQYAYDSEGHLLKEEQERHENWEDLTSGLAWEEEANSKDTYQYDADGQETEQNYLSEEKDNSSGEWKGSAVAQHCIYQKANNVQTRIIEWKYSDIGIRTHVAILDMEGRIIIGLFFKESPRCVFDDDGYLIKIECDESASVLNWEEYE